MASVLYTVFYMVTHQENRIQLELLKHGEQESSALRYLEIEENLSELLSDEEDGTSENVIAAGNQGGNYFIRLMA